MTFGKPGKIIALLLLTALMAGCGVAPVKPPATSWDEHQRQLQLLNSWHIAGKMGYRQDSDGGTAWLDWQQSSDQFTVRLSGPFGAGTTLITGNSSFAQLEQADQQPITASNATALTEYLFGWPWPVDDLHYWVRGIPSPLSAIVHSASNSSNELFQLEQAGWSLEFSRYQYVGNYRLPGKIRGTMLTNSNISFTLIIKSWQLPPG